MLIQIAQFLLGLSLLIVIHEFGHFLPAKYFGIKVSKVLPLLRLNSL